jgi:hypothetical protein
MYVSAALVIAGPPTIMLVEAADERAHLVIPELHIAIVQGSSEERLRSMECNAFDSIALGLELR